MKNNKQGFSFVEIIVVIGIIVILAIVAVTSFEGSKDKAHNSKVETELSTLKNAYITYGANATLPLPDGNLNFYNQNGGYEHDYEGGNTFGISGFVTQNNLPKQYINILPLDPKTNQYYGYALTKKYNGFQLAGVFSNAGEYKTKLFSTWQGGINNDGEVKIPYLIKEYSGPNFVSENSEKYFPYNPEQNLLTAKIDAFSGNITINGKSDYSQEDIQNYTFTQGDTLGVSPNGWVDLYYSDGSYTVLGDKSQETQIEFKKMEFQDDTNLLTSIRVVLNAGTLWNKAVKLGGSSEFEIETPNAVASVRGTIFGVSVSGNKSNITVKQGKVEVRKKIGGEEVSLNSFKDIIQIEDEKSYIEVLGSESEPKGIQISGGNQIGESIEAFTKINSQKSQEFFDASALSEYIDVGGKLSCQYGYKKISGDCMKIGTPDGIDIESLEDFVVEKYKQQYNEIPSREQIEKYIEQSNASKDIIEANIKNELESTIGYQGTDWKLFASAEFDNNLNMVFGTKTVGYISQYVEDNSTVFQYEEGNNTFSEGDSSKECTSVCTNPSFLGEDQLIIYEFNNEKNKGILVENTPGVDYLKYNIFNTGLSTDDEFKIEISLRGAALKRKKNIEHYIFQLGDNKLYLEEGKIIFNEDKIATLHNTEAIEIDKIYTISISFLQNEVKFQVSTLGETNQLIEIDQLTKGGLTKDDRLYVGSSSDAGKYGRYSPNRNYCNSGICFSQGNQWNDIIDYVRIYKK